MPDRLDLQEGLDAGQTGIGVLPVLFAGSQDPLEGGRRQGLQLARKTPRAGQVQGVHVGVAGQRRGELNLGQLALLLNGRFPVRVLQLNKVQGRPFRISENVRKINEIVD